MTMKNKVDTACFQWGLNASRILSLCALLILSRLASPAQTSVPPDSGALLRGEGMGMAALAELHGYPGPKHVLELKDELKLTRDQFKKAETLAALVKVSASAKGEEIVDAESELQKLFESGTINEKTLRVKLEQIGKLRAELRFIHLQAHIRLKQILNQDQIRRYYERRGHEVKAEKE